MFILQYNSRSHQTTKIMLKKKGKIHHFNFQVLAHFVNCSNRTRKTRLFVWNTDLLFTVLEFKIKWCTAREELYAVLLLWKQKGEGAYICGTGKVKSPHFSGTHSYNDNVSSFMRALLH